MKTAIALMLVSSLMATGCKKKQPAGKKTGRAPAAAPTTAKAQGVPGSAEAPGRRTFLEDFEGDLDYVLPQVLRLAKAVPQDKYTWRADPKTMSLAEIFLHIAGAHFNISRMAGNPPPPDIKAAGKKLRQSTTDKREIIKLLERSFAHAKQTARKARGTDLSATAVMYGKARSKRFPFLVMMVHQHEHLGQIKAWTRSAGIKKPWLTKHMSKGKGKGKGRKAKE